MRTERSTAVGRGAFDWALLARPSPSRRDSRSSYGSAGGLVILLLFVLLATLLAADSVVASSPQLLADEEWVNVRIEFLAECRLSLRGQGGAVPLIQDTRDPSVWYLTC